MARKVKTKIKRKLKIDEFTTYLLKVKKVLNRNTLPHHYIVSRNLYAIILNYNRWHKENYNKTIKQYLFEDYLVFLKELGEEQKIIELMGFIDYKEEQLLKYAKEEKEGK